MCKQHLEGGAYKGGQMTGYTDKSEMGRIIGNGKKVFLYRQDCQRNLKSTCIQSEFNRPNTSVVVQTML